MPTPKPQHPTRHTYITTLLLAALCLFSAAQANAQNSFAVTNVRVFDGEQSHPAMTVIVRDGLIDALAPAGELPDDLPDNMPTVDGTGMTLLPGFIDSHVHVFPGSQEEALRFGVTAMLDMYHMGGIESAEAFRAQRDSLSQVEAADTWSAMYGVTPPGGHPSQMSAQIGVEIPTLADEDDAAQFIQMRIDEGADYIKIMQDDTELEGTALVKFSDARLREIIQAVHAAQRLAVVHVSAHAEAVLAFESGADMIAHVFQDQAADEQLVNLARERNGAVISTLSVLANAAGSGHADDLLNYPGISERLSPMQQQTLSTRFGGERPEILENALESIRRFHAAGVAVLAGTDTPNPGTANGLSIHQELELLVEAGMSPTEALRSATALPAERFGLSDRGRIADGLRADLLLVEGDPTADILNTRHLLRVWKNGYEVAL